MSILSSVGSLIVPQTNRGVKMTILGALVGTAVRVGLCFVPVVPTATADQIMWGIFGMFGASVAGQKMADGMSAGKTATVTKESTGAPTVPAP